MNLILYLINLLNIFIYEQMMNRQEKFPATSGCLVQLIRLYSRVYFIDQIELLLQLLLRLSIALLSRAREKVRQTQTDRGRRRCRRHIRVGVNERAVGELGRLGCHGQLRTHCEA